MRISSLGFSGIKSFERQQHLDIKPFQLVYGSNSSGKSTVLQALLLLKQSAPRAYGAEPGVLEFRGGSLDLGGFTTFVHGHDTQRRISIELGISGHEGYPTLFDTDVQMKVTFGHLSKPDAHEAVVLGLTFTDSGGSVDFEYNEAKGGLMLANAASSATLVDRWIAAKVALPSTQRQRANPLPTPSEADKLWLRQWARTHVMEAHQGWVPYWPPTDVARGKTGRPYGGSLGSPRNRIVQDFVFTWYNWAFDFGFRLVDVLSDVIYVGPLRDFPRRVVADASDTVGLGVRGERLVLHLARRQDLVDRVNEAFRVLEIPYTLQVRQLRAEGTEEALGDVAVALLNDNRTGITVSPADVGFGISQILPVVVQLVGNTDSLVLIEQPEIHLHPKMQSRLADIIIASATENRNFVIVETHSEHLLFRAQRRLRERRQPDWDAAKLGVAFVSSTDGCSDIQQLQVSADGELLDPWPDGFFDDRLDDLLASI